jgi:predicted ATPase/DNA-binding SARP family transcriptional activator
MEFRILGPVEVWEADRRVSLGGAKHRALLAILLINANRVVGTHRLIELLWGDEPSETVNNTLQVSVSQLRKVLEPDHVRGTPHRVLVSQEPGYLLRVSPAELDLGRFEQLRDDAKRARLDSHLDVAAAALREALTLWRGPPLADLALEPFAIAEVSRLKELGLQTTEDRIEADLALGRHADLIGELEALVAEHPLRERLRGQLMLALYRCGRQAEASDLFHKTREALVEGLGMEPGPELQKLFKAILNQSPSLDVAPAVAIRREPRTNNLPLQLTSFVGRVQEMADVRRLLSQSRLVTVTGAGGVGKTRLAIQIANQLCDDYRDGVWLVELAPVAAPGALPQAVMAVLGIREQAGRPLIETLTDYLQEREMLLVLDNCEHVVEASAQLVASLLQKCPDLHILTTSREALGVGGELPWRVRSLSVPDAVSLPSAESVSEYEGVALFVDRASSPVGSFVLNNENAGLVAAVCQTLDGIPLAIELAAAKLKVLSLAQIAERLSDRFRLLTGGSRTAMPRQQTLRAAIDWSYDLLPEAQQATLRWLSVFVGGISLDAAEAVCAVEGEIEAADVIDLLAELVAKSLLLVDNERSVARYRLIETVRQYGREKLFEAGEAERVRDRHRSYFQLLAEQGDPELRGKNQAAWLERFEMEHDNLRGALAWSLERGETDPSLRLAGAMGYFWRQRGHRSEGLSWLQRALSRSAGSSQPRARALLWAAGLTCDTSDYAQGAILGSESLAISTEVGDQWGEGYATQILGAVEIRTDRFDRGLALFDKSLDAFRRAGDPWGVAFAFYSKGFASWATGDYEKAREQLHEGLALFRQVGDGHRIAASQQVLGYVQLCLGNYQGASDLIDESLDLLRRMDKEGYAWSLNYLGIVARCLKDYDRAAQLLEQCFTHFRELNHRQAIGYSLCEIGIVATLQGDLSRAETSLKDGLELSYAVNDKVATAKVLEAMAAMLVERGQFDRAARLLGSAAALRTTIEAPIEPFELEGHQRLIAAIRKELGEASFGTAWTKGEVMPLEEVVSRALSEEEPNLELVAAEPGRRDTPSVQQRRQRRHD